MRAKEACRSFYMMSVFLCICRDQQQDENLLDIKQVSGLDRLPPSQEHSMLMR